MKGSDSEPYDPRKPPPRVLWTQLAIAILLGLSSFLSFCVLRYRWPKLYAARTSRRKGIPVLPNSLFGWVTALYNITEAQVLEHAGLDAFVFLGFFKASIQLLVLCSICALTIISPIRLYYTGRYEGDDDDFVALVVRALGKEKHEKPPPTEEYQSFLWLYVVFTYVFTALIAAVFIRQTLKVIRVRQKYLGGQNSITDRTIRISGISPSLRTEAALKYHVENLGIGIVRSISLCRDWGKLDTLFDKRDKIIRTLEGAWCEYLGPTWMKQNSSRDFLALFDDSASPHDEESSGGDDESHHYNDETQSLLPPRSAELQLGPSARGYKRPTEREGLFGLFGPEVDIIDKYTEELEELDAEIEEVRKLDDFPATGTAFVTMDSVASAQMVSQAVLDPRPLKLIADVAPAPHDVVWRNLYISSRERFMRTWSITFVIAVVTVAMFVPLLSLATFLEYDSIKKLWPGLAELLAKSEWALTFVTGILPPTLLTIFNILPPFLFAYLSSLQGFISQGEVELSVISKNFFYVFYNMFLFLLVASANYWSFLQDTTKIAYELAKRLREYSKFYVDLIILQGIGMYPLRLVQMGSVVRFPWSAVQCRSPRDYRDLYKPPIFNYGLQLPQPLMILIIVILYSVVSTKILTFGTIYFVLGYFTFKYQLLYSMVHPQHSTGQAWPIIFRRVCLGTILFHLAMAGILALQRAYFLATTLAPLPLLTLGYLYNFEKEMVPLLHFIALRAIESSGSEVSTADEESIVDDEQQLLRVSGDRRRIYRSQSKTLDEQRERFQTYVNPNTVRPLDGPWIGLDGDEVIVVNSEGTMRRRYRFEEWE